ncbi:MAG TPA: hypothetical protein DCR93_26090, partial [Cytophagales bacterium]|nr:hypothetical protein [Cytophagales bacterium]
MAERNPIPKLAKAFFRWYCKPQRYEELHGDLEEFFYNRLETEGLHKARLFYWYNVLRCCQPYAWKVPKLMRNSVPLLKSYFKTSVRSMLRNPLSTFINVLGLSVAVGVAMLAFAFTQYVYKKESLHERRDSVYLTTFVADRDGTPKTYGNAPAPLGGLIQENTGYTVARVQKGSVIVKEEEQIFTEQLHFVDPSFLQLLSFPLKWGNPVALEDKNGIILTETMAEKYFGGRHPIGQELQLIFGTGRSQVFTVIGVAFDISPTSSIYFHFLVHFDNLQLAQPALDLNNWQDFLTATLVEAPSAAEATALLKKMDSYRPVQNEAAPDWAVTEFGLEPLASVYLASAEVHTPLVNPGSRENQMSIYFLGTLSVVILLLACFNYLNMAIATAAKRLKEIGVRKAIGAHRARVMAQFLIENILLAGIALALGLVLGLTVTIPGFEFIHSFDMGFTLWDPILGWFLLFTLFLTGIASGLYPALFISRIQVVGIFQKKVKLGQGNRLTKGLLGFQLILSCISITCAVFFTQNADYVGQRAWGYEPKGVLYTPVANGEAYRTLRDALEQKSYVRSVAQAEHHLGKNHRSTVMQQADRPYEVDEMRVGEGYATTMGLRLTDGRWFESDTD